MNICAPTDILSPKYLFSLRRRVDPVLERRQSRDDRRPYAETKEQLGGIQILEARDLNHAVQLVSQLPGFKYGLGPIEIRPVADLSENHKGERASGDECKNRRHLLQVEASVRLNRPLPTVSKSKRNVKRKLPSLRIVNKAIAIWVLNTKGKSTDDDINYDGHCAGVEHPHRVEPRQDRTASENDLIVRIKAR